MRIRVAGIISLGDGIAFMHRQHVQDSEYEDYYTFPGGGLEKKETLEEGTKREIKEEFGINVEVIKQLYKIDNQQKKEYFFLCKYIDGVFGTGDGPEFTYNPKYAHRGTYTPVIIKKENIKDIILLPKEIKELLVKDIENNEI